MTKNYTDIVKFVCCILIFLHHFYLASNIVAPLGYLACAIFFFLSAWGVSKSLDKKDLNLWQFIKRRVAKVYIPLLLVNFVTIVVTQITFWKWSSIPVFGVFCNEIKLKNVSSPISVLAYLLDVYQIDSITWFVHVLLLVYLFVWATHKIESKGMYATVVIATFVAVELVIWLIKIPAWYMVDIVGVLLGLLIYKFEYELQYSRFRRYFAVGSIFLLIASLVLFTIHIDEYSWKVLTGFAYSAACVMLVWLIGQRITFKSSMTGILGGASFYVYLWHVKITSLFTITIGDKYLILSLSATLVISWLLMKLNTMINHA